MRSGIKLVLTGKLYSLDNCDAGNEDTDAGNVLIIGDKAGAVGDCASRVVWENVEWRVTAGAEGVSVVNGPDLDARETGHAPSKQCGPLIPSSGGEEIFQKSLDA